MSLFKKLVTTTSMARPSTPVKSESKKQMNISSPVRMEGASAFLAQEQEIDQLRAENQALRRENFELQAQNEPLGKTIDLLQRQLKECDLTVARLAGTIRGAFERFEIERKLQKDENIHDLRTYEDHDLWDQWSTDADGRTSAYD